MSIQAKDLIEKLLIPDSNDRIKSSNIKQRKDQLTADKFFAVIEWDKIRNQKAPFIPNPIDKNDTSYFNSKKPLKVARNNTNENSLTPINEKFAVSTTNFPITDEAIPAVISPRGSSESLNEIDGPLSTYVLPRNDSTVAYYNDTQAPVLKHSESNLSIDNNFKDFSFINFAVLKDFQKELHNLSNQK